MGWAEAAVAMAGFAMQGLGMWLGGGGEERTPFTYGKKGRIMGNEEAKFTGDMVRNMLTDARQRGFASTAPRVKFEVPQIHTRSADVVLPFSGRSYKAGGTDLGLFQQTQSLYAGLGAGQDRTTHAPWTSYIYDLEEDGGDGDPGGDPGGEREDIEIIDDDGDDDGDDTPTTTTTIVDGDDDGDDDGKFDGDYSGLGKERYSYTAPPAYQPPPTQPPAYQPPPAQPPPAYQPQGPAYDAGAGSMGDEFRRVAALRDSVARRGKLDRSGGAAAGAPAAAPAAAPVGPAQRV